MSKRVLVSKEGLIDIFGNTVLHENIKGEVLSAEPSEGVHVIAEMDPDHGVVIILSNLNGLIRRNCVKNVYVQYECGIIARDSVTYLWSRDNDHIWINDGTISEGR